MVALSAMIERRLRTVGNVSGRMMEKSAMRSSARIGKP
jgi:hypothetical protein